jgi:capsular exopolysaccharide synthesis family protein
MGRIADALKRADRERKRSSVEPRSFPGVGAEGPRTGVEGPAAPSTSDALRNPPQPIALVQGLSDSLVPYYEPTSLISEQYRSLRTRLLSQNPNYEHRVLAITSAAPREGKSVSTLNLGCTMAEIRHLRVLVVDGDFRRSSLARMLNQNDHPGLAEVLSGSVRYEDVIRKTPVPNLFFVPAGTTRDRSAAEILTAPTAKEAFRRMRHDFHYTIIDTPPATTVTDVGIIGQMCDGVVVIVRLNRTHEALAKRAVRLLQANNVPILGALAIGRDSSGSRYGYGYGYGYYYHRYYEYYRKRKAEA